MIPDHVLTFVSDVSCQTDASLQHQLKGNCRMCCRGWFHWERKCLQVTAHHSLLFLLPTPLAPGHRHLCEDQWLDDQVSSFKLFLWAQRSGITSSAATELLPSLSIGHSQVCKLFAANFYFVIRPLMVVSAVVSIFNSTLAILGLSEISHSFWCMQWLFCVTSCLWIYLFACHFCHFAFGKRVERGGIFQTAIFNK